MIRPFVEIVHAAGQSMAGIFAQAALVGMTMILLAILGWMVAP